MNYTTSASREAMARQLREMGNDDYLSSAYPGDMYDRPDTDDTPTSYDEYWGNYPFDDDGNEITVKSE